VFNYHIGSWISSSHIFGINSRWPQSKSGQFNNIAVDVTSASPGCLFTCNIIEKWSRTLLDLPELFG
jgi:hypothetical protein